MIINLLDSKKLGKKNMNNKKIDDIGEKLNVNSSEIKPRNSPNWFKKHSFWIVNVTNFILSILVGITFGILENSNYLSNYPYTNSYKFSTYSLLGVSSINIANGVYTIPKRKYFNLNQILRIGVYIINLIISFAVYRIIYQSFDTYGAAIKYGVYKSHAKSNIQNQKVSTKDC